VGEVTIRAFVAASSSPGCDVASKLLDPLTFAFAAARVLLRGFVLTIISYLIQLPIHGTTTWY
jgi:UPF0716 family protein affecting phage T7 exclusion